MIKKLFKEKQSKHFKTIQDKIYSFSNSKSTELINEIRKVMNIQITRDSYNYMMYSQRESQSYLIKLLDDLEHEYSNMIKDNIIKLNANLKEAEWNSILESGIGIGKYIMQYYCETFKNEIKNNADFEGIKNSYEIKTPSSMENSIRYLKNEIKERYNTPEMRIAKTSKTINIVTLFIAIATLLATIIGCLFTYIGMRK